MSSDKKTLHPYRRLNKDSIIGLAVMLLGGVLLLRSGVERQEVMLLPRVVFFCMLFVGICLSTVSLRRSHLTIRNGIVPMEFVVPVVLFLMVMIIPYFGFYATLLIASLGFGLVFVKPKSAGKMVSTALKLLGIVLVVYIVFRVLLGIKTPRGVFF